MNKRIVTAQLNNSKNASGTECDIVAIGDSRLWPSLPETLIETVPRFDEGFVFIGAGMNYLEQLQQPEWREKSKHIFQIREFTCERCGAENTTFNAHHKYYDLNKKAWDYPDEAFECLCTHCHQIEHIPTCCKTPLFMHVYNKDMRQKILTPAFPLYCFVCGTPLIPGSH